MFNGRLPSFANTRSMRVAGGLGTIPRVVGDGQEIYHERIHIDDALGRIETLYKPYHRALRRLINQAHQQFGSVLLVDCHSMPSVGISRDEPKRPDVVIGDRYGTSCSPLIAAVIEETMAARGYSTGRNKPYAGGFITEHYGNPATGLHTVQVELNRRSTWMSGCGCAATALPPWPRISAASPSGWPRSRWTISAHFRRQQSSGQAAKVAASRLLPLKSAILHLNLGEPIQPELTRNPQSSVVNSTPDLS